MVEMMPMKAVNWLLYTHEHIRAALINDEFVNRQSPLAGLGGIGSGTGMIINDPTEDYTTIKAKYLNIISTMDFIKTTLSDIDQEIFWLKWIALTPVENISKELKDAHRFTGLRTIGRRIHNIKWYSQAVISANIEVGDIINAVKRFGIEARKKRS
jgi:hypothetical protein